MQNSLSKFYSICFQKKNIILNFLHIHLCHLHIMKVFFLSTQSLFLLFLLPDLLHLIGPPVPFCLDVAIVAILSSLPIARRKLSTHHYQVLCDVCCKIFCRYYLSDFVNFLLFLDC